MPYRPMSSPYARAACALIDELKKSGIAAEVGYEADVKKRNKTLVAYVREEDVFRVPREWRGFKVAVHMNNELASAGRGNSEDTAAQSGVSP